MIDEPATIGDLLRACNAQPCAILDHFHELTGFIQVFRGTAVEPGDPGAEIAEIEPTLREVKAIDVRDLNLAAWRRPYLGCDVQNIGAIQIKPGHGNPRR